jgi:hypothetical protein
MRRLSIAVLASLLVAALVQVAGIAGASDDCEWLAGDLHIHSTHSYDSYGGLEDTNTGPEEAYTLGHSVTNQFAVAAVRGLDYLAITDHNDIRSQQESGFGAFGVTPIAGYENSLKGHAQMLGAKKIYDNGAADAPAVQAIADGLRSDGGLFQINHPAEGSTDFPHDRDWAYGDTVVPDSVEVWNISRAYQPPLPSGSSNDDAIRFWEGFLDAGEQVAATGGSDNHYVATTGAQGAGQPTTWVCATGRTEEAILEGIRSSHTFISHQPPAHGAPRIFLEGDGDGQPGYEAIVGDEVAPGSPLRVRVEDGTGSLLRVVSNDGSVLAEDVPVTSPSFPFGFQAREIATWARAEIYQEDAKDLRTAACDGILGSETTVCRNDIAVLAMTSAIYLVFAEETFDPTTTLTYVGDTAGKVGSAANLAAKLNGSDGPIAGAAVTFTFQGKTYNVSTGVDGVARTTVRVLGPPGAEEITATYAGSDRYRSSNVAQTFLVTTGN